MEPRGNRGEEIMGKTVGIIGYGNMGKLLRRDLSVLDVMFWHMISIKAIFPIRFAKKFKWKAFLKRPIF